ncbi:MAG: SIMPL domain-containing protein [Candidatus Diapherotrites archaeon]|nr:SIMPL domain-containing protein [Candidatus Diapherotrites archaeon]
MDSKNALIAGLACAVLVLAAGFAFLALGNTQGEQRIVVQVPGYLTQSGSPSGNTGAAASGGGEISFAADDSGNQVRLISVSGSVTKTASPELAYVTLSVETLDRSASKSQSDNAVLSNRVMDALKAAGIAADDIETTSYSLNEEFQWDQVLQKSESIGYRTTNSIQVTVRDLAKVGSTIDAAVEAGANSVSGVSFGLTTETQSSLRTAALQDASANARAKAQSIATGLGIGVGSVYSASESSNYYTPVYYRNMAMETAGAAAPTPISPGDIEFTATVSVQFEIQ